jgi:hypothetical protein
MRYAVVATIIYLNYNMMLETSSTNSAAAYAVGLLGSWGIMWGLTILIWMNPQFDAARVERRRRVIVANGRQNGHAAAGSTEDKPVQNQSTAPDESVAAVIDEYEYYWQPYPDDAPFLTRLEWAVDLVTAFRGIGRAVSNTLRL